MGLVRGLGLVGRGGRMRRGGNLGSCLDLGAAEALSAEPPGQGLGGTCPPLVVAEDPPRARGAYASFILDPCKRIKMKSVCVCVYTHKPWAIISCRDARPETLFLQKE